MQMERKAQAEQEGRQPEADPRTIEDAHGNFAVMHAIARGNNNMAALLDACAATLSCSLRWRFLICRLV